MRKKNSLMYKNQRTILLIINRSNFCKCIEVLEKNWYCLTIQLLQSGNCMYYLIIEKPWFWIQFQDHLCISNCVVIWIAVVGPDACIIQLWSTGTQWIWAIYWSERCLQLWSCHVRTPYWAETVWQVRKMCFASGWQGFNWPLTLLFFFGKFTRIYELVCCFLP